MGGEELAEVVGAARAVDFVDAGLQMGGEFELAGVAPEVFGGEEVNILGVICFHYCYMFVMIIINDRKSTLYHLVHSIIIPSLLSTIN